MRERSKSETTSDDSFPEFGSPRASARGLLDILFCIFFQTFSILFLVALYLAQLTTFLGFVHLLLLFFAVVFGRVGGIFISPSLSLFLPYSVLLPIRYPLLPLASFQPAVYTR